MFNLIHAQSIIKVDFIIRKNHEYRLAEFKRRKKITIADFTTYIVSIEDLIISKLIRNCKRTISRAFCWHTTTVITWISKLTLTSTFEELHHE